MCTHCGIHLFILLGFEEHALARRSERPSGGAQWFWAALLNALYVQFLDLDVLFVGVGDQVAEHVFLGGLSEGLPSRE